MMEHEPRRVEYTRLSEVRRADANPKLHDVGEIVTSIKKRGFVELPAVDERTGKLVAGHGRIEALAALKKDGGELPKGLKLADDGEWLVPVLHGWASKDDTDAKAYLVASNRLVEVGGWDDAALESLLVSIAKEGGAEALLGTGYDGDDVDKILSDLAKEPSAVKHQGDVFQVLVEVSGEVAQSELMTRLEGEGFKVRPLIF
jgi:ParB-like chromosome segregation protein Spo0J